MNTGLPADQVERALGAARKMAEDLGARVAIAVVDVGGNLGGFLRLPGAFLASSDLAIDKAWTAASFGASTRGFSEMLEGTPRAVRDGLLRRPRVTEVPGGMPIMHDGRVIGALGVSGGSEIEDEQIAEGGLAAFGKV
ncbi:GlcG/HbpS family heme-binding protein [Novosphingobium mangrovi (ex Huang et al. 2023)]|uniref:Heme-binding protein n=1 Tax=Novosphingobium mangrovi (ex Huang et al. 2023) TaxID=2976432 RepID=A0ABT2I9F3_9SPHN|nr:heme-binding protein [Novosphingobium mangrovi (ex Huang et al. 2023)]MCT2401404.1 heme-binding protein [Novosphingobium mangrovi (ex Huang et al. 2023)]